MEYNELKPHRSFGYLSQRGHVVEPGLRARNLPRAAHCGERLNWVMPHLCGKEAKQRNKPWISSLEVSRQRGQVVSTVCWRHFFVAIAGA